MPHKAGKAAFSERRLLKRFAISRMWHVGAFFVRCCGGKRAEPEKQVANRVPLPVPKHPENRLTRVLQTARQGTG